MRGDGRSSTPSRGGVRFRCPASRPLRYKAPSFLIPMRSPSIRHGVSTNSCPNVGINTASGLVNRVICSTLVADGDGLLACSSETSLRRISTAQMRGISLIDICRNTGVPGQMILLEAMPPSPLPSAQFDLAFAFSVFSHLSPKAHLAWRTELARVMKPNGLLFITTHRARVSRFLP